MLFISFPYLCEFSFQIEDGKNKRHLSLFG